MTNTENEPLQWSNVKNLHSDRFIESNKQILNVNIDDNLHPEARKRLQMLGLLPNDNEQQQEEMNPEEETITSQSIDNEDPAIIADKYMMEHNLYELFKRLTTTIVINRPSDPIDFMINDLEKQVNGKKSF